MPTTKQPSFLARTTLGPPNYLLIAMASLFMLAMAPLGAWKAMERRSNEIEAWLPASSPAVADQQWFNAQFDDGRLALVSWDDCTLGNSGKLAAVARRLRQTAAGRDSVFARVETGPQWIERLAAPPYGLAYEGAVARLEGTFVGPPQRDARGASLGHASRATCLAAHLTAADDAGVEVAVAQIRLAALESGVDPATLRIAGPAVDSSRTGNESFASLLWWGGLTVIVGGAITAWRLRSLKLAALVAVPAVASGAVMLSVVFYSGVLEVLSFGRASPMLGVADGLVLATPVLIYALTTLAALRMIHGYRDARLSQGVPGAAEQAVADGWPAWAIVALMFAATMGGFCFSELLPLRRFGLFSGLGALASVGAVLSILPVWLHRFPLTDREVRAISGPRQDGSLADRLAGVFELAAAGRGAAAIAGALVLVAALAGMQKVSPTSQLPALASARSALAGDYQWFADKIGHAVPVELAITMPRERERTPDESPDSDGQQYRMTPQEQLALAVEIDERVRRLPEISGVVSAATLLAGVDLDGAAAIRDELQDLALVNPEQRVSSDELTARQAWRISGRIRAATPGAGVDYEASILGLRNAVNPVLQAYQQRDWLVRSLRERGRELRGSTVCILFAGRPDAEAPAAGAPEALLGDLLSRSSMAPDAVSYLNVARLNGATGAAGGNQERAIEQLRKASAIVIASGDAKAGVSGAVGRIAAAGIGLLDLSTLPSIEESIASPVVEPGGPRSIRYVLAGEPLSVSAVSLAMTETFQRTAQFALVVLVVAIVCLVWHPIVGLAVAGAVLFPLGATLGAMGWMNVHYSLATALIAGLAIGCAIDATTHYVIWFRRGLRAELFRHEAARMAFARCAPATVDGMLAVGIGLSVLALSQSAAFQLMGFTALGIAAATLLATLVMLPAIMASPLAGLMGAEDAPQETTAAIPAVRIAAHEESGDRRPTRTDVAAAGIPAPTQRGRAPSSHPNEAHDAESPHAALQAKLQRLRHASGE
jgi:uncharacterized protein